MPTLCGGGPIGFAWCGEARLYHATAEREWDDFSGRVSLEWQVDENILAYGSVATGFRSGAIGGVVGFDNFDADGGWLFNGSGVYRGPEGTIGLKPFEPETVTNYELGVKSTLADGRVLLNATLFFSQFDDQLVFQPHPDAPFSLLEGNIGESEAKGLDLSLNWAIDEHWLYVLGAEVLDTELVDLGGFDASGGAEEGISLTRAPELSYATAIQYSAEVAGSGEVSARLEYNYKDEVYMDLSERRPQDSVGLVNLIIRYDSGEGWYAFLNGRNLTEEEYYLDNAPRVDAAGGAAIQNAGPGKPRTFEMGVGMRF